MVSGSVSSKWIDCSRDSRNRPERTALKYLGELVMSFALSNSKPDLLGPAKMATVSESFMVVESPCVTALS